LELLTIVEESGIDIEAPYSGDIKLTNMGLSPYAFMMANAMAASASFMTPISHPANILVVVGLALYGLFQSRLMINVSRSDRYNVYPAGFLAACALTIITDNRPV
jgi:di/tricarboxylate transporter